MSTASVKYSLLGVYTAQAVRDGEFISILLDMAENVCLKKNEALTNLNQTINSDVAQCREDRSENLWDKMQEKTSYLWCSQWQLIRTEI